MSECKHRWVQLANGTRCNLCGLAKAEWELGQKVADLETKVAGLLAACEAGVAHFDKFTYKCDLPVYAQLKAAITAAKGENT